jgi:hypothetical protein
MVRDLHFLEDIKRHVIPANMIASKSPNHANAIPTGHSITAKYPLKGAIPPNSVLGEQRKTLIDQPSLPCSTVFSGSNQPPRPSPTKLLMWLEPC